MVRVETDMAPEGGRLWGATITPYGHARSGSWIVRCFSARCARLGPFTDLRQARAALLAHLGEHHQAAGAVPEQLRCRCRAEDHSWHPGPSQALCAGGGVRVLSSDPSGVAWRLSEVCRTCAEQIPRAKVVGAQSKRTLSERADHIDAPNQATHRTTAASFLPPQPTTCSQAPSGGPNTEQNQPKAAGQSRLLTFHQGQAARQLLAYIATLPLTSLDARLLAVIVAIRAAREGRANFIGQDLRSLRLDDPAQALADLGTLGWLPDGDLLNGDPSQAISVTAPGLGPEGPLQFGKQTRTRVSGWTSRVVSAKPLKKARPDLRLAALYLAAHADPGGRGTVAGLPQECVAAAPGLRDAGYLDVLEHPGYGIAEGLLHLVPSPDLTAAPRLDRPERFRVADRRPKTPATHIGTPRRSSRMLERE